MTLHLLDVALSGGRQVADHKQFPSSMRCLDAKQLNSSTALYRSLLSLRRSMLDWKMQIHRTMTLPNITSFKSIS